MIFFLKTIIITNFVVFFSQWIALYFVTKPYFLSFIDGEFVFNPKIDRKRLFIYFGFCAVTILFYKNLFKLEAPYGIFDMGFISFSTIFNVVVLFAMLWCFWHDKRLFQIKSDFESETLVSENKIIEENSLTVEDWLDSIIIDKHQWDLRIGKLQTSKVIDENNCFLGIGPNYSCLRTQFAVFIYDLHDSKIIRINNQKNVIPKLSKLFKVELSPAYYSQVKGTFNPITGSLKYDFIRKKIQSYI